ncbi:hypothetical protein Saut_0732 [Sulfurimonas autotrophica DSM 16294]|uniref:Uncharacterized protein n=1 Tax=Sulfurimonas autotrophica (strain ATCC BAA-671 / DSM 16294 / JCM 11897 / OK10) TaxID=563040 RepID=E0UQH9_SULAO|nr:hypothetical protein Saut_0732 [Sulfurimonas autotrophica DSM 16294]
MHYFFIGAVSLFVIGLFIVGAVMDKDDMRDDD